MPGEYGWTDKQFTEEGVCFHREPANIGKIRDDFLFNGTTPLWNDLSVKVKEAKSRNGFKAGVVDGFHLDYHSTK